MLCAFAVLLSACAAGPQAHDDAFAPSMPEPVAGPQAQNGSIYHSSNNRFLFEDLKARRVGDLITVILDESTNAKKNASTNTSKDSSVDLPGPTIAGLPVTMGGREVLNASLDSESSFSGSGDSSQSNSLSGNITVTVAQVLSNGNLVVRGEKLLTLNNGSEIIRISGIVRSHDVTPENTVESTQIANANITYSGRGAIADSNRQGWLARFFSGPLWPF
ncbi:flagellar basal body L-ring protein FlgH [Granulosicoccaceae sp. 1_MG-2023]|nr:flagellar basal body L-ring protein FlgH [Granulosicoccaceae sp. 1_MG-2023]